MSGGPAVSASAVRDPQAPAAAADLVLAEASSRPAATVLGRLGSAETGLTAAAAAERLSRIGPNAIVSHRARLGPVLWHQLRVTAARPARDRGASRPISSASAATP